MVNNSALSWFADGKAYSASKAAFWSALMNPFAWHALKLTFGTALVMVAVNAVMGTLTAWVLVRYPFPGKGFVNALIDLPFALPTIVAGLTLVALYGPRSPVGLSAAYTRGAVVLALLFVTLPFVVRTVQPTLLELDREMEEAAASLGAGRLTVFRRIVLPNLVPAILSGVALAYENEAILAQHKGQPVVYLIPKATIRIENPVAVTTKASAPARAFVSFLHTAKAQTIFGQNGYRPVLRSVVKRFNYPVRPWLFTIQKLGGWSKVEKRFFDPKGGVMAKIEAGLGK